MPPPLSLDPQAGPEPANPIQFIHRELLERVAQSVTAPSRVLHFAYLIPEGVAGFRRQVREAFDEMIRTLGITPRSIDRGRRYDVVDKSFDSGHRLRLVWELHTEFYCYTLIFQPPADAVSGEAFEIPSLPEFPQLGQKLVDVDLLVEAAVGLTRVGRHFLGEGTLYGGAVLDGLAHVWTTFNVDAKGQERYVVSAGELPSGPLGRLIRRLVEIENYYHLVLLPLEAYRIQIEELRNIEQRVTQHSEGIAKAMAANQVTPEQERAWLEGITQELAVLVRLTERMRYRLSAASAYFAIFRDRIARLRERAGEDCLAIGALLHFRVDPAIRNYENFVERADALSAQLNSLAGMLRTRVDLVMEEQNLKLLQSMEKRARLQLLLQQTVERLSVIVIAYYLTGLAGYVFAGLGGLGWIGHADLWTAGFVPVSLLIGYLTLRRAHQLLQQERERRSLPSKGPEQERPGPGARRGPPE